MSGVIYWYVIFGLAWLSLLIGLGFMGGIIYWYVILGMTFQAILLWTHPEHIHKLARYPRWMLFISMPIVIMLWPLVIWKSIWKDA